MCVASHGSFTDEADRNAVSISSIHVTDSRANTVLRLTPNAFPATRYVIQKDACDDSPIEYVQVGTS